MFIETSAKAGHNVKTLFKKIAQALPGMDKDAAGGAAGENKSECCALELRGSCVCQMAGGLMLTQPCNSDRRHRRTGKYDDGGRQLLQVLSASRMDTPLCCGAVPQMSRVARA